ncbi:hypothetical protein SAMD00019534_084620, partial [Acytostelium subglobosum LB1]|uniref:hypothetical protein n=1 Tax=Acytostelium subglobosum LB1 TaxID=1410327 RepID=UPI0006450EA4
NNNNNINSSSMLMRFESNSRQSKDLYYVPPSKLTQSQAIRSSNPLRQSSARSGGGGNSGTITPPLSPALKSSQQPFTPSFLGTTMATDRLTPLTPPPLPPLPSASYAAILDVNDQSSSPNTPLDISITEHRSMPTPNPAEEVHFDHYPQPLFSATSPNDDDDHVFLNTVRQIRQFKFGKKQKKHFLHFMAGMLPVATWLPKYSWREDIKGDLIAGITVGVMLIPQGMAYALVADLPMVYGLYSSIMPIIAYCMFGSSRHLSMGPFAIISLLSLETVNREIGDFGSNMELRISLSILLSFMCGAYQILFGLLRFGFVSNFLSDPVKTGFISGCALIIGSSQLKHVFGFKVESTNFLPLLIVRYLAKIKDTNWWAVLIAVTGYLFLLGIKKVNQRYKLKVPGPLLVVVVLTFISWIADLNKRAHIDIVGPIPSTFPVPTFPTVPHQDGYDNNWLSVVIRMTPGALVLVLVGFITTVSVGSSFAEKYNYEIQPNQELLALGMADFVGSFFQSFPIGASLSRTAVNSQSGAKSQLSSFISSILVLCSLFFLTPIVRFLPKCILASIVIVAIVDLVEFKIAHQSLESASQGPITIHHCVWINYIPWHPSRCTHWNHLLTITGHLPKCLSTLCRAWSCARHRALQEHQASARDRDIQGHQGCED